MPRPHRVPIAVLCALVAALGAPAGAFAGFFAGDVIDGPGPDLVALGGLDVAGDGSGAVVYVKRDGGVEHVFASRLVSGRWQAPERLDPGLAAPAAEPVVAASDSGRLVVAFTSGGQLFTVVRPAGAAAWPAPVAGPLPAAHPSLAMSINGVAYLAWTALGDVRAARLERKGTSFTELPGALDVDPARVAGEGTGRPQVAVSADGTALVAWGEADHVYARRLFELRASTDPQDLTVDALGGQPGGAADLPVVRMQDDSSFAWVSFRETLGGEPHVLARRLVGSLFDPPVDVAGGPADAPALDVAGRGEALFAAADAGTQAPVLTVRHLGDMAAPLTLGDGSPVGSRPQPVVAENSRGTVAWLAGPADAAGLLARTFADGRPADQGAVSDPALGPVVAGAGLLAADDRAGDAVVLALQGPPDARRLVAGGWDRPPAAFAVTTTSRWRAPGELRWAPSFDLWGPMTYTVLVDGRPVGSTTAERLVPAVPIADGVHRWRVQATDPRGQSVLSRASTLRVDGTPPRLALRVDGTRKARRTLKLAVAARDGWDPARVSGVRSVTIDFGDGGPALAARRAAHVYRRPGRYVVTVTATDAAGNVATLERALRIRR